MERLFVCAISYIFKNTKKEEKQNKEKNRKRKEPKEKD